VSSTKNYITPAGLEKLKAEYAQLFHGERPKLVETIAWAASNGDRSENADYIYGKRRLREIDRRLGFLGGRIEKAHVVDPKVIRSETVVFGATLTVINQQDKTLVYQIVGEDETDATQGKISWRSPLASAFMGKRTGDDVPVQKPSGEEIFSLEKIEYI
jgi:transcription elongation factor GreB